MERGLAAPKRCKECRRARKERAANGAHPGSAPGFSGLRASGNSYGGRAAAPRHGAPLRHYTGDVNEYRSPMQDGFSGSPYGTAPRTAAPRQRSSEYRSPMPDGFVRRTHGPLDSRSPRHAFADGGSRDPRAGHDGRAQTRAVFDGPARDGNHRADGPAHDGGYHPHAFGPRPPAGDAVHERGYSRSRIASPDVAAEGTAGHDPRPKPWAPAEPSRRRPQAEMFAITCDTCGAQAEVPFKPAEGREVYCPACYRARRPSA
jgi:CxxC-x17-CxxC domain-containing protein